MYVLCRTEEEREAGAAPPLNCWTSWPTRLPLFLLKGIWNVPLVWTYSSPAYSVGADTYEELHKPLKDLMVQKVSCVMSSPPWPFYSLEAHSRPSLKAEGSSSCSLYENLEVSLHEMGST